LSFFFLPKKQKNAPRFLPLRKFTIVRGANFFYFTVGKVLHILLLSQPISSLKSRGKQFVPYSKTWLMWSDYIINNANGFCFAAAVIVSLLFYRQYRKYEEEAEREDMIERFLR
jgi:hypothetical protein